MELPQLGTNCSFITCRRLDFLPVKCGGCGRLFCKDHYPYDSHACSNPGLRDKQVPVCPLCNAVVPLRPGELPDVRVGHHIDTACQSKPALELKGKIFSNACSFPRCKKREVVACHCERCGMNFCMGHRNELDHQCQGVQQNNVGSHGRLSAAGAAAIFRAVFKSQRTTPSLYHPAGTEVYRSRTIK
ncbi:AN1-type zinc finger protein 2B [Fasciola hepatica]|uniref:AN1-type zinc finger protein 2B n=1 Tax=Fasciola hepatica TaxID=6192 RepID=A0A4E0RUW5_FASHE|nr:AN1-type zinc finger protein 2B [Fasciola hepatica]